MKTIVMAYGNMGCAGLSALLSHGYEVCAVFTHVDDPNEHIWFDSVAELAARHDIPVYAPENINHPIWVDTIRAMEPDILFSFYYRKMLGKQVLSAAAMGGINLHGSLLPAYRGRAPINWVLVNGETQTGVTLHHMTEKPDDGDIIAQLPVDISREDTAASLGERMLETARALLEATLPLIRENQSARRPQDPSAASYFGGRTPDDGRIDWSRPADEIYNLVRAVSRPFPGAFTYRGNLKFNIWDAASHPAEVHEEPPGTILSVEPLKVACGKGALSIRFGQTDTGIYASGKQLSADLNLVTGIRLGSPRDRRRDRVRKTRVLILGINGFIGNALTEKLLSDGEYEVHGMDLNDSAVTRFYQYDNFFFHEGDISINKEWIEYHVKKCDVILPLVAIATPIAYTNDPIGVFELDFEQNLEIIRYCVKYQKRLIFPSTSEVYGMCEDETFDEDSSNLVLGPINKQRWIYSCSKQLLDRVIWAYGQKQGLRFTLFRPFNWIGPRLDSLESARIGSSRAITQLILNLVEGEPIQLIDGGAQKRCFTDLGDGIDCLYRIIRNEGDNCDSAIINIGNPDNEASIRDLAVMLTDLFGKHPDRHHFPPIAGMKSLESKRYYGDGYEDVKHRKPDIRNARKLLDWSPKVPMTDSIAETLDYFLAEHLDSSSATQPRTPSKPRQAVSKNDSL